jgi:hypothetical protein
MEKRSTDQSNVSSRRFNAARGHAWYDHEFGAVNELNLPTSALALERNAQALGMMSNNYCILKTNSEF